jgi:Zn-dependent protease with chaperone function
MEEDSRLVDFVGLLAVLLGLPLVGGIAATIARTAPGCFPGTDAQAQLVCSANQLGGPVQVIAAAAAALGIVLMGGIALAGAVASRSRVLLVALFAPGLYVTNLSLAVLVLLHGALAIATLLLVAALIPIPLIGFALLAVALGTLLGTVTMINVATRFVRRARADEDGRVLDPGAQPALWQFVRGLAADVGTAPPSQIIAGMEPTFFVTEAEVHCAEQRLKGRTMYLSLPLSRILTQDELRAILGHELAHFHGWDTQFSRAFAPIYHGTITSLIEVTSETSEGYAGVMMWPAISILRFFFYRFHEARARISRTRELAADALGARVSSQDAAATALVKVHAFERYARRAHAMLREAIRRGEQDLNLSRLFEAASIENQESAWLRKDLDEEEPPHPTDTHPPLSRRLSSLGVTLPDVAATALRLPTPDPAVTLISSHEALEREMTLEAKAALIASRQVFEGTAHH